MTRYAPKALIISLAMIGLAGCAVDPVTGPVSGGPNGGPVFASGMEAPRNAVMIVGVARSTAAHGDLRTALALYRRAYSVDSTNFDAAAGMADALARLGVHDEAADAWRLALQMQPNNTTALRGMGNTLVASGRPALALAHYERALAIKPDPRLYNGCGVALDMLENYNAAQAYYRVGLKDDPKNLSLRNNLGLSLMLSGKIEQAVTELKRAASDRRAGTQHRMNLALALVHAGDSVSALSIARQDLGPREANDQIAYFETLRALGDSPTMRQAIQAHIRGTLDRQIGGTLAGPIGGMVNAR